MKIDLKKLNLKFDRQTLILLAVFAFGIFLRVYHFSDWLYFKRDEARDATIIWRAFTQGPGWLPLLGPNATGASFFTGPIYYYFQYIATVIFHGAQPAVLAYPDLFFSILTVPLAYLYLRKFFNRNWSIALTALFSVDFLAIQYSRFAWNPNTLPFFNILFFYALLNVFDAKEKRRTLWAAIAGVAFALTTQLHVLSLTALPAILVIFLVFKYKALVKYLDWKKIAVFIGVVVLLYIPMITNEILTNGHNTKGLINGVNREPYYTTFADNIYTEMLEVGHHWFLVLTGYISTDQQVWTSIVAWLVFILPGLVLAFRIFRKEKDENKRSFVLLAVLWLVGYLAVYFPVALHMEVRFVLPVIILPIVFLGIGLNYLWEKKGWTLKIISAIILAGFLAGNIAGVYLWFQEIAAAQQGLVKPERTIILKEKDGIVLWHLEQAAKYMERKCQNGPIYYYTGFEYYTPLQYVFLLDGADAKPLEAYDPARSGCIFMFDPSRSGKGDLTDKEEQSFDLVGQKNFGVLKLHQLVFRENADISQYTETLKEKQDKQLYWHDVFQGGK